MKKIILPSCLGVGFLASVFFVSQAYFKLDFKINKQAFSNQETFINNNDTNEINDTKVVDNTKLDLASVENKALTIKDNNSVIPESNITTKPVDNVVINETIAPTEVQQTYVPKVVAQQKMCYSFESNFITPAIKEIPNSKITVAKETKLNNIYWGLGTNEESANTKLVELKKNNLIPASAKLSQIGNTFAILVQKEENDDKVKSILQDMNSKTASFGGKWFSTQYLDKTFNISFTDPKFVENFKSRKITTAPC